MRIYQVKYYSGVRSRPYSVSELSKSGTRDGARISLFIDGGKYYQAKFKNGSLNGLEEYWSYKSNDVIINFKKAKIQGIYIAFNL